MGRIGAFDIARDSEAVRPSTGRCVFAICFVVGSFICCAAVLVVMQECFASDVDFLFLGSDVCVRFCAAMLGTTVPGQHLVAEVILWFSQWFVVGPFCVSSKAAPCAQGPSGFASDILRCISWSDMFGFCCRDC